VKILELAYGGLGLRPDEFWSMSPHDFYAMSNGFMAREDREMDKLAWLAAAVMSPHITKPITPDQLRGKRKEISEEEHKKNFAKLKFK
jgi:hypothetical protein